MRDSKLTTGVKVRRESGRSFVELAITLAIIMIFCGIAIPTTVTSIANMRLRGTASDFAGLLQQARINAVQSKCLQNSSKSCPVVFGLPSGNGAYVDVNGNGSFDSGEPMIQFSGTANNVSAPAGASGKPSNVDAAGGPLGWTATSGNISFNARGLPCNSSTTPCGTNVSYVFYFSDTRALGSSGWAAVSVTAAARTKVWWWNGSSWN